ncbi:MAG TPA: S-layer homology domain-containing protein [Candidatus Obscuribacterales bacterium]
MMRLPGWSSLRATLMVLGVAVGAVAPTVMSAPATAASFSDIDGHWSRPYVEALAKEKIITGFADGSFKPDQPVTRAEFATLVQKAFNSKEIRESRNFKDVPDEYWAKSVIEKSYSTGFMAGYPYKRFRPEENISRVQALVSLSSGLNLSAKSGTQTALKSYSDANEIPKYAVDKVVAATEKGIGVNDRNVNYLNPNQPATRGDVAAFIYQAKVSKGEIKPIATQVQSFASVVSSPSDNTEATNISYNAQTPQNPRLKLAVGRQINVMYTLSEKVVVTPAETINMTVIVANDIKNSHGKVLIPQNSEISGQLVPLYRGANFLGNQFVAEKLIVGDRSYNDLNATSSLIVGQQLSSINPETLQDAAISPQAQVTIKKLTGQRVNAGEKLDTASMEKAVSKGQDNLVVIDQQKDWQLTLESDLYVNNLADATMP